MYELVTCYTITPLPLIRHVARCLKPIDGIFAVLSFLPKPGVILSRDRITTVVILSWTMRDKITTVNISSRSHSISLHRLGYFTRHAAKQEAAIPYIIEFIIEF